MAGFMAMPGFLQAFGYYDTTIRVWAISPTVQQLLDGLSADCWHLVLTFLPKGSSWINIYTTYFLTTAGVTAAFSYSIMVTCMGLLSVLASLTIVRHVDRRVIVLVGVGACGLCQPAFAVAWTVAPGTTVAAKLVVAFISLFTFFYTAYAPHAWLLGGEYPNNHVRAHTYGIATALNFLGNWLGVFTAPYLINPASLGRSARYGYIWFASNTVLLGFTWFLVPETRDRTLQEVHEMFAMGVPARKFKSHICVNSRANARSDIKERERGKRADLGERRGCTRTCGSEGSVIDMRSQGDIHSSVNKQPFSAAVRPLRDPVTPCHTSLPAISKKSAISEMMSSAAQNQRLGRTSKHHAHLNLEPHNPQALRSPSRRPQKAIRRTMHDLVGGMIRDSSPEKVLPSWSASLLAILWTFIPSFLTALGTLALFCVLRRPFRRIYSPRTFISVIPPHDRTPASSRSRFEWLRTLIRLDDEWLIAHSEGSVEGYLFLRFLRVWLRVFGVVAVLVVGVLVPVDVTGGKGRGGLEDAGIGNLDGRARLWVHAAAAWAIFVGVMAVVLRERLWLIGLRRALYAGRAAGRVEARTVVYLDPPKTDSDGFGEGVRRVWTVRSAKTLSDAVQEREDKAMKLEYAETRFLCEVNRKVRKHGGGRALDEVDGARPTQRPFVVAGPARDLISKLRREVLEANEKVGEKRTVQETYSNYSGTRVAAIVEYETTRLAQQAYRGGSKLHIPIPPNLVVQSRLAGVAPGEILWRNVAASKAERAGKKAVANASVAALIVFWSVISGFVGSVSNAGYLADNVSWLEWIKDLPDPVLGLLTGLVPPLVTSALSSNVPNVFRWLARTSGEPTTVTAELQVQAWYYAFSVLQTFLLTAVSSSAVAIAAAVLQDPTDVPELLARNIPTSSYYFVNYLVLQGLVSASKSLLNISDLFWYIVTDRFVSRTPRQRKQHWEGLKGIGWGKVYPKVSTFVIIGLVYSCVSPVVVVATLVAMGGYYLVYRHQMFFVVRPKLDTKGRAYARALQQILTGCYLGELCMLGLFSLRKSWGPTVAMAVLFGLTAVMNAACNRFLHPLEDYLPEKAERDGEEGEDEQRPLLGGDTLRDEGLHLPPWVARLVAPTISASYRRAKDLLSDLEEAASADAEDDMDAYVPPALTTEMPVLWLPSDNNGAGLSKKEIESLKAEGLDATDEGAWIDEKGRVRFEGDAQDS